MSAPDSSSGVPIQKFPLDVTRQLFFLKSVWERLMGDLFYERRYAQTPLVTNRFFCYFLLNKKPHISYNKGKMQSNFPKYYLVPCWFFSIGMSRTVAYSSTHLTKTAVVLGCLSSCCFVESSLYEAYYPCIILLISSSSPASSLPQVATAGPELKFSCAIDPVTSPLNCTASVQFAIY